VSAGAAPPSFVDLFTSYHEYLIILSLALIGFLSVLVMLLTYFFRAMAEVVEAYYEFRLKCAGARKRIEATGKKRLNESG
jgi:hypothetical protein